MISKLLASLALTQLCAPAWAQNPMNYAQMGQRTWTAFKCAYWAEFDGDLEERERLLAYGLSNGRALVESVQRAGFDSLSEELRGMPDGVLYSLDAPTVDFIVGRIYERASAEALAQIEHDGPARFSELRARARGLSRLAGCARLGGPKV